MYKVFRSLTSFYYNKIRRAKLCLSCTKKWCIFLQLAAKKKTPFWVQLKQISRSSYFVGGVTTLRNFRAKLKTTQAELS
jgi:hypothetical protein